MQLLQVSITPPLGLKEINHNLDIDAMESHREDLYQPLYLYGDMILEGQKVSSRETPFEVEV
jgi:hypothetical protein